MGVEELSSGPVLDDGPDARARVRLGRPFLITAAVVVAALLAAAAITRSGQVSPSPPPSPQPAAVGPDVVSWPTRGSLSADLGVIAAARARMGEVDGAGAVLAVPFAGEVAGTDVVLGVIGPGTDGIGRRLVAVTGTRGTPVRTWAVASDDLPSPEPGYVSAAVADPARAWHLLVLTPSSGVSVAVSDAPRYDQEGVPTRSYRRLPLGNGVGTRPLPSTALGTVVVRVDNGAVVARSRPTLLGDATPVASLPLARAQALAAGPRCAGRFGAADLAAMAGDLLGVHGLTAPPATVDVLWCRRMPHGRAAMIAVTAPDGSAFQSLRYLASDGPGSDQAPGFAGFDGRSVPRTRALDFPAAVTMDDVPGPFQVIVSAPGAAAVTVVGDVNDLVLGSGRVDSAGFGVLTLPQSARVWLFDSAFLITRDADGRQLERVRYVGIQIADPLGLDLDGPVV